MNRREFARGLFAFGVGWPLANGWCLGTDKGQRVETQHHDSTRELRSQNIELGIQLYSVRDECQRDLPGTLKGLREMGYRELEFFTFYNKPAAEIRRLLSDLDVSCRSAHYHYPVLANDLEREIEYAKALGLQYMVSAWVPEDFRKTRDAYLRIADTLNRAGERCRKAGIQLLYHNHNFEFRRFDGQSAFDLLLQRTTPDLVRLEIDCYWMITAGEDPVRYIEAQPPRCSLLHLKDRKAGYGTTVEMNEGTAPFTVLGKGGIDHRKIIAAAKRAGVLLAYVDQDACEGEPMMCAQQSIDGWNRLN